MARTEDTHVLKFVQQGAAARAKSWENEQQRVMGVGRSYTQLNSAVDRNSRTFMMNRRTIATGVAGLDRLNRTLDRSTLAMFKFTIAAAGLEGLARIIQPITGGIINMGVAGVKASNDWEVWEKQLRVTQGSIKGAEKMLSFFYKSAKETPFNIAQIVEAGTAWERLKKSVGVSTREMLPVLADLAASAVGNGRNMMSAANAMADALQGTTNSIRRLYNIQGDAITTVAERMKKEYSGMTNEQLRFMAIMELMGPRLGMHKEMMDTLFGDLSRVGDAYFRLKVSIGDTITKWDTFRGGVRSVSSLLEGLAKDIEENSNSFRTFIFGFTLFASAATLVSVRGGQMFLMIQGLRTAWAVLSKTIADAKAEMDMAQLAERDQKAALGDLTAVVNSYAAAVAAATTAESVFAKTMGQTTAAARSGVSTPASVVGELRSRGVRVSPGRIEKEFESQVKSDARRQIDRFRVERSAALAERQDARSVAEASSFQTTVRRKIALDKAREKEMKAAEASAKTQRSVAEQIRKENVVSDTKLLAARGITRTRTGTYQGTFIDEETGARRRPFMKRSAGEEMLRKARDEEAQRVDALIARGVPKSRAVQLAQVGRMNAAEARSVAEIGVSKAVEEQSVMAARQDRLDAALREKLARRRKEIIRGIRDSYSAVPGDARRIEAAAARAATMPQFDVRQVSALSAMRGGVVAGSGAVERISATRDVLKGRIESAKVNVDLARSTEEVASARAHLNNLTKDLRKTSLLLDAAQNKGRLNLRKMSVETATLVKAEALEKGTKHEQARAQIAYDAAVQRSLQLQARSTIERLRKIGVEKLDAIQVEELASAELLLAKSMAAERRQLQLLHAEETRGVGGLRKFGRGAAGAIGGFAKTMAPLAGFMAVMGTYSYITDRIRSIQEAYKDVNRESEEWMEKLKVLHKYTGDWDKHRDAIKASADTLREYNIGLERRELMAQPGLKGLMARLVPEPVSEDVVPSGSGTRTAIAFGTERARGYKRWKEMVAGFRNGEYKSVDAFYKALEQQRDEYAKTKYLVPQAGGPYGMPAKPLEIGSPQAAVFDEEIKRLKEHHKTQEGMNAVREYGLMVARKEYQALDAENSQLRERVKSIVANRSEIKTTIETQEKLISNLNKQVEYLTELGLAEEAAAKQAEALAESQKPLIAFTQRKIALLKAEIKLSDLRNKTASKEKVAQLVALQRDLARAYQNANEPEKAATESIRAITMAREYALAPLEKHIKLLKAEIALAKEQSRSFSGVSSRMTEYSDALNALGKEQEKLGMGAESAETLAAKMQAALAARKWAPEMAVKIHEAHRKYLDAQERRTSSSLKMAGASVKIIYDEIKAKRQLAQISLSTGTPKGRSEYYSYMADIEMLKRAITDLAKAIRELRLANIDRIVTYVEQLHKMRIATELDVTNQKLRQIKVLEDELRTETRFDEKMKLRIARNKIILDLMKKQVSAQERLVDAMIGGSTALGIMPPGVSITRTSGSVGFFGERRVGPFMLGRKGADNAGLGGVIGRVRTEYDIQKREWGGKKPDGMGTMTNRPHNARPRPVIARPVDPFADAIAGQIPTATTARGYQQAIASMGGAFSPIRRAVGMNRPRAMSPGVYDIYMGTIGRNRTNDFTITPPNAFGYVPERGTRNVKVTIALEDGLKANIEEAAAQKLIDGINIALAQ